VKLLPPLGRRAGFRNTTTHGIAWNAEQGHSILKRFSEGHHSTPFIHGNEGINQSHTRLFFKRLGEWDSYSVNTRHSHLSDSVNSALSTCNCFNNSIRFPVIHTLKQTLVYTKKYVHIYALYTHTHIHSHTPHTITHSHKLAHTHNTYVLTQTFKHSHTHTHTKPDIHPPAPPHTLPHTHFHTHSFSHRVFLVGQVSYATQNMINSDDCRLSWSLHGNNSLHKYYILECADLNVWYSN
jgi:hypothetical protein